MKTDNIALFAYDFPHKKTQDFIIRLKSEGYGISYVLAAPKKKLSIRKPGKKINVVNENVVYPGKLCKAFGIDYIISDHNSKKTINYIDKNKVDLYVITGARILSDEVINTCGEKILNIHPGLLPENRGLDTLLWSITNDLPIGITGHLISRKIDSGKFVYREKLMLRKDDCLREVMLRLLEKQSDVLMKCLELLSKKDMKDLKNLDFDNSKYYSRMSGEQEVRAIDKFPEWLKKYSTIHKY